MGRLSKMLRDPVAWILAIAGVVEMISGGTPARGAILFAGAALITLDRIRVARAVRVRSVETGVEMTPDSTEPAVGSTRRPLVASGRFAVLAVGGSLLLSLFAIHSWPLTVGVGLVGVLGLAWAWLTLGDAKPAGNLPVSAWFPWGMVLLILGLWEMSALISQPTLEVGSYAHPTISFLLDPILATYPGRVLGVLIWLAAGRALVRRA
jgi:hypothetical protein